MRLSCLVKLNTLFKAKYPGGWEQCLEDHSNLIGGRVWYDEYLFRDGAMGPAGIEALVQQWADLGFEPMVTEDGKRAWKECCVTEHMFAQILFLTVSVISL